MPPSRTKGVDHAAAGGNGPTSGTEPSDRRLERSLAEIGEAIRQVQILADIGSERVRLRVRRSLARLQARICAGIAMAGLVIAGVALVAIGMLGACRALFIGRPWLGELVAGAALLAGVVAWGLVRRVLFERAELRRIGAKHEALEE